MLEFEFIGKVRDFVETGGNVLLVIAFATAVMWTLIYERFWYFRTLHKKEVIRVKALWYGRSERSSWEAGHIRRMLISDVRLKLMNGLNPIQTLIKVAPMLGLLGTVTGMIEVFDVMAGGSGNARGMAAGVSKAHADHVTISGNDGGTGASPLTSISPPSQAATRPKRRGARSTDPPEKSPSVSSIRFSITAPSALRERFGDRLAPLAGAILDPAVLGIDPQSAAFD